MSEMQKKLTEDLFAQLKKKASFVMLHTIDADSAGPTSSAISWIYAVDPTTLRFAIDQRSRLVGNIRGNSMVAISVFSSGTVYEVTGKTVVVAEALEEVPFKLTCIDVAIESVRDAMFYGARITSEPEHEKTYDQRAADKLDDQVFTAMKKA